MVITQMCKQVEEKIIIKYSHGKRKKNLIDKQKSNRIQSLDFETTKKNIIYTTPKKH